jgi:hypothetical protein
LHAKPHWLALHVACALATVVEHAFPQLPQLLRSVVVSVHSLGLPVGQPVNPLLQVKLQLLPMHAGCPLFTPLQALPHVLQFFGSLVVSVHVPLHSVGVGALQPVVHPNPDADGEHTGRFDGQTVLHPPQ